MQDIIYNGWGWDDFEYSDDEGVFSDDIDYHPLRQVQLIQGRLEIIDHDMEWNSDTQEQSPFEKD